MNTLSLPTTGNESLVRSLEDLKNSPAKPNWLDKVITVLKGNKSIKGASCRLFADFAVAAVENNLIHIACQVICRLERPSLLSSTLITRKDLLQPTNENDSQLAQICFILADIKEVHLDDQALAIAKKITDIQASLCVFQDIFENRNQFFKVLRSEYGPQIQPELPSNFSVEIPSPQVKDQFLFFNTHLAEFSLGKLDRKQAENLLSLGKIGSWLVRYSLSQGKLVLSQKNKKFSHIIIQNDTTLSDLELAGKCFNRDLLIHSG